MGQRILVFESDAQFARELQANFRRLGADVEVVDDGNVGLERATANRPDLILLSIELPRMNGFLVCKKIKKSAELKDIPLVILSSEATEEIFEQHKKLRTRAEEYIHKPVSFAELLERIKEFVPIGTNGGAGVDANAVDDIGEDEVLDIDDMSEIGEEGVGDEAHADAGGKGGSVDDEIDAFAESAFGALVMNEDAGGGAPASAATLDASRKPARRGRSVPPEPMRPDALRPEPVRVPSPVRTEPREEPASRQEPTARHSSAPPPRPASEPAPRPEPGSGAFRLNAELNELREQLGLAQRRAADADRFEKELSDLKARAAKGGPISSREFLELREGLNRKDKEILDLREQLSRRDRQLIETNESSLTLERRQQDHLDRILEIERELADARDEIDLLVSARDDANKRAEEIKARSDKDVADVRREKAQAIEGFEAKHAEESARTSASHAMELERLRNEQETATATATEAHERARKRGPSTKRRSRGTRRRRPPTNRARSMGCAASSPRRWSGASTTRKRSARAI